MAHVCPVWIARLLASPVRRLVENPEKIMKPFVNDGMTVFEPGCGMGFFTIPLARMVGKDGRVVVADVQQPMLEGVRKRAEKAGLEKRIDCRLVQDVEMPIDDLEGKVDFVPVIHMLHETTNPESFLQNVYTALKRGGSMLIVEPAGHVSKAYFEDVKNMAKEIGFVEVREEKGRRAVFMKEYR